MTDLNERGLKDGLVALNDVRRTVVRTLVTAEAKAAEAEGEQHAQRKILGFIDQQIAEYRHRLEMLQKEEPK